MAMHTTRFYKLAVGLDPLDPAPLFNLASANYEQALYTEALANTVEAVGRLNAAGNELTASRFTSILKAAILSRDANYEDTIDAVLSQFQGQDKEVENLKSLLLDQRVALFHGDEDRIRRHHCQVLDYVPRLRPALLWRFSNYCHLSFEVATSFITPTIRSATYAKPTQLAFLLGECHDPRHIFATLLDVDDWEERKYAPKHQYHFTVVDTLPHYTARLAVFFYLLMTPSDNDDAEVAPMVMSMAFSISRMPRFVYDILVDAITAVKESLVRSGTVARCPFLWIPQSSIPAVIDCLASWSIEHTYQRNSLPFTKEQYVEPHTPDKKVWNAARIVRIPDPILFKYDFSMSLAIREFEEGNHDEPSNVNKFVALIKDKWIVNPFFWDATVSPTLNNIVPECPPFQAWLLVNQVPSLGYNKPDKENGVLLTLCDFFNKVSRALQSQYKRITIEAFTSDLDATCERMCVRYLPHRENIEVTPWPTLDTASFPWVYDHIYCGGNINLIGNILPLMEHCVPLLKHAQQSVMTATVLFSLRYTPTIPMVVAEYTALRSPEMLFSMAGVAIDKDCEASRRCTEMPKACALEALLHFSWWRTRDLPTCSPSPPEKPTGALPYHSLVLGRRSLFLHWAMTLFWRIILPPKQMDHDAILVGEVKNMPENICSFIRLLAFAQRCGGFPGHWINSLLSAILSGRPTVSATIPQKLCMTIEEAIDNDSHVTKIKTESTVPLPNTSFWVAELSTMLAIWRPVLGWGLALSLPPAQHAVTTDKAKNGTTSSLAHGPDFLSIPPLSGIASYSATIQGFDSLGSLTAPPYGLLLWDKRRLGGPPNPAVLLTLARHKCYDKDSIDDNISNKDESNKNEKVARDRGDRSDGNGQNGQLNGSCERINEDSNTDVTGAIHVISVFEWKWDDIDHRAGVATWWMRKDIMDSIRSGAAGWELWLYRTTDWQCMRHSAVPAHDVVALGSWEELLCGGNGPVKIPRCNPSAYAVAPAAVLDEEALVGASWFHDLAE